MNTEQIGKITVDEHYLRDKPEDIVEAFCLMKFLVVRAEMMFHRRHIEYIGISPMFEEVPDGAEPPWYELIFHLDEDGKLSVDVEKMK